MTLKVGDIVRYNTGPGRDRFSAGRVIATETYIDIAGSNNHVYVRWFDVDGRPGMDVIRHNEGEVQVTVPEE